MYFICGFKGSSVLVKDTSDGVVDSFLKSELLLLERQGVKIEGLVHHRGSVYFIEHTDLSAKLFGFKIGTPVRVKITDGVDYKQSLYAGVSFSSEMQVFHFYDDSGVDGYIKLSADYFKANIGSVQLDFDNTDERRVVTLQKRIRDSGGFII